MLNDNFCEMAPVRQACWVLLKNGSMEIAADFLVLRGLSFAYLLCLEECRKQRQFCVNTTQLALQAGKHNSSAYLNYHLPSRGPTTSCELILQMERYFPFAFPTNSVI